jgi:quercetin 2,3-dioxygenase
MLLIRKADERFHTDAGWLDSRHTFSFGGHYDPDYTGFRALLVVNDDRVAPGGGFGTHGHQDMEIVSYVVAGALSHADSMGTGSVIRPGDVQRMSAGTGVRHSEKNADPAGWTRFLQIWIAPDQKGHPPSYEQQHFPVEDRRDRLRLVAAGKPRDGAILLHQDVAMYAAVLSPGARVEHAIAPGRHAWVQVVRGDVALNGEALHEGDGAAVAEEKLVALQATTEAELLLFDLA